MTRTSVTLSVDDLSGFTRRLAAQMGADSPGHLTLMNMLARAGGYQNVQHLRAVQAAARRAQQRAAQPVAAEPEADLRLVERVLNQFDARGVLLRWPARQSVQTLALFVLWAQLPAGQEMTERQVNALLTEWHGFGDPATLRRTMIACKLLTRQRDGSGYRRLEQAPPPELALVLAALRQAQEVSG